MIEIPPQRLSAEALAALIEDFVLREGTDYGERETPFDTKTDQVRRQIDTGKVVIVFDPDSETCNLMTREAFDRSAGEAGRG